MRTRIRTISCALLCFMASGLALAEEPIMYPNRGQSMQQLEKDKYECYEWAKSQSGFDPLNAANQRQGYQPPPPPPPPRQAPERGESVAGGAAKGGLVGALVGAGLGALLGGRRSVLPGAVVGGVGGAVIGGTRQDAENDRREAARQPPPPPPPPPDDRFTEQRNRYERAFEACLEGRGYTIK